MNKIVCELCGGVDLVKEEEFFVCQHCGCKYTVEAVRKMMVEGVVEVTGTVKVDNTAQAENLRKLADDAYNVGNYKEAGDAYNRLLEILPNDPYAIVKKGMCMLNSSKMGDIKASEAVSYGEISYKAFMGVQHTQEEINEYRSFIINVYNANGFNIYRNAMNLLNSKGKYQQAIDLFIQISKASIELLLFAKKTCEDDMFLATFDKAVNYYSSICGSISQVIDQICLKRKIVTGYTGGVMNMELNDYVQINSSALSFYRNMQSSVNDDKKRVLEKAKALKEKMEIDRVKSDPEELKKRVEELDKKIGDYEKKIADFDEQISVKEMERSEQQKIYDANKGKIFGEGARLKKAAQSRVDSLYYDIRQLNEKKEREQKELDLVKDKRKQYD